MSNAEQWGSLEQFQIDPYLCNVLCYRIQRSHREMFPEMVLHSFITNTVSEQNYKGTPFEQGMHGT